MAQKKKRWTKTERIFVVLLILALIFAVLNVAQAFGWLIPEQPILRITGNTVDLDSMSLEQKIAQMVVVIGDRRLIVPWRNMQVGGIHIYALPTEHIINNTIIDFQHGMPIPFFVTADVEGCFNPFSKFKNFTTNAEIDRLGGAFEKGFFEGAYLKELGVNFNFAPVVDLDDQIWKCRSFPGDETQISELAQSYILGLQTQGVLGNIKHYPGKTLVVKDPHKNIVNAEINEQDLFPYHYLLERGDAKTVMVSHLITTGEVDSKGVPSVVSPTVIQNIKDNYPDVVVVSDEIHMLGLKKFYATVDEMYVGVFNAGNDIVLNFDRDPNEVYRMIQIIKDAVVRGVIEEQQIDDSVEKILKLKGFDVVR